MVWNSIESEVSQAWYAEGMVWNSIPSKVSQAVCTLYAANWSSMNVTRHIIAVRMMHAQSPSYSRAMIPLRHHQNCVKGSIVNHPCCTGQAGRPLPVVSPAAARSSTHCSAATHSCFCLLHDERNVGVADTALQAWALDVVCLEGEDGGSRGRGWKARSSTGWALQSRIGC